MIRPQVDRIGVKILAGCVWAGFLGGGCVARQEQIAVKPLAEVPVGRLLQRTDVGTYGFAAFVYREGKPGGPIAPKIYTDLDAPDDLRGDDTNLILFVPGSGDEPKHFRHTARLLAESKYHPLNDHPNLAIGLVPWSETTSVVREHLNYRGQANGAELLRRMCKVHQMRHPDSAGFVGIIGFSAGTRVIQLAFGATLPQGRPADKPPSLSEVPEEMEGVDNVVYLGSSINNQDPLPFSGLRGRFMNFVNWRDSHFGDRAPYYAPAGTSPIIGRVVQANLYLSRPGTGASANGFLHIPTLTTSQQFDLTSRSPEILRSFKMVNVNVPDDLVPLSPLGIPILDDNLDTYRNRAPNHYTMVGRGPGGTLHSRQFDQYKEVAYEFVREQVASAVMYGRLYRMQLRAELEPETDLSEMDQQDLKLKSASNSDPTPSSRTDE